MEFLRFGSSIPGSYWGCCACCIIQNFTVDPEDKASIQLVSGDGGQSLGKFAGPTYRDIFWQRLRIGTFSTSDMPNHAFLAILTEWQINSSVGKKWLAILKEAGFEFIRTVNNSVYSGQNLGQPTGESQNNDNHIFGLFRNIGGGGLRDQFTPPKAWTDLPKVVEEAWEYLRDDASYALTNSQHGAHTDIWNSIGKPKFLTEKEVVDAGAPVILAGQRSKYPQQGKEAREQIKKAEERHKAKATSTFPVTKAKELACSTSEG